MCTEQQYLELVGRKREENKLNVSRDIPCEVKSFNQWFWENYPMLRPVLVEGDNYTLDTYKFMDQTRKGQEFHDQLRIVDHWITSDGAVFMLVEGTFVPGTKKRSFWFTVDALFHKEPAKTVYYIMKNGLIYEDE